MSAPGTIPARDQSLIEGVRDVSWVERLADAAPRMFRPVNFCAVFALPPFAAIFVLAIHLRWPLP